MQMSPARSGAGASGGRAWSAFLVMAFVVVGLCGLFASYAAPLPLERAVAREATLDRVIAASHAPDAATALAALRPLLGDSADAVLPAGDPVPADLVERVARERTAMRERLSTESAEVGLRLRVMLGVFTFAAALFGVAVLSVVGRR